MQHKFATKLIAFYAGFTPAMHVFAHDGHALSGSHWHASDVGGFVALGAMVALAVWLGRGGK